MADFSLNSLSGWLTACSVKGYQLQMVSDNKHDQIWGRFRRGTLAKTWFWRSLVSIHPFSFGLFIHLSTFLLYQPFCLLFLSSGLSLYNLFYSLQDIKSLHTSNTSTHQNWKNKLWICNFLVYYLLFHSRYLLKRRSFSANHNLINVTMP